MTNPLSFPKGEWHVEYITPELIQAEKRGKILFEDVTPYQTVVILEGSEFGKSLILDGKTQSTEMDEFIYHEVLVHPALTSHDNPKKVFIAGGGEGATAREVLKHNTVQSVVMVDIDEQVVKACQKFLPSHHKGSFEDPRMNLIFGDAAEYLEQSGESFDVIIIDVPDPIENGPAHKIFTREFYQLAKKRLGYRGIIVVQSGPTAPSFAKDCFTVVANTIKNEFISTASYHVFVPAFGSTWGFTIGSTSENKFHRGSEELDKILTKRDVHDLLMFDGKSCDGLFGLPLYLRKELHKETRIITEHDPLYVV